jgi:pSer/pThr/pTyr-binding forkhead associated (FHA) protein
MDTGVSRRHAELRVEDDGFTLVDLNSTNGTTVNNQRVSSALLAEGDRIGLGATVLVYRQDA